MHTTLYPSDWKLRAAACLRAGRLSLRRLRDAPWRAARRQKEQEPVYRVPARRARQS